MTFWRFSTDDPPPDPKAKPWESLPPPALGHWDDPADYIADQALLDAASAAVWLGQPLLLTGEPGCGKTELANHLAWRLGLGREIGRDPAGQPEMEYALRCDVKSETRARDLFYTLDILERFHAAQCERERGAAAALRFIRFQALGRAILYARPPDRELCGRLEGHGLAHPGEPRRSVVLIDEIDKAPRDLPNDLLMEVEQMRFHIPELNRTVAAPRDLRPILVITSNAERALPDAFLRRCVYYHLPYPKPERLREIVARRLIGRDGDPAAPLIKDAVEIYEGVRQLPLHRRPGTAELLGFVQSLRQIGYGLGDAVRSTERWMEMAPLTLLKTREDQEGRSLEHLIRKPGRA